MKNYKKFIFILLTIALLITIFTLVQTYAKYISNATGNATVAISRWNILVNNTAIKNNSNFSTSLVPVFPGNEHIASGIIAPSAEGYFDLNLDFTNVDVSFKYTIKLSSNAESAVQDFVATGYSINNSTKVDFSEFNGEITNTISLNSERKTENIRIYVKWDENPDTSIMNNIEDTLATIDSTKKALFDINISFIQII